MKKTLSRLPRVVRLAALSAVVLALCSKSSPLYAFNDWMDANIFFTMGRSMLGGRVLYRDVFDHKGPVLYLLYGLAGLVGGTDFRGVLVLEIIARPVDRPAGCIEGRCCGLRRGADRRPARRFPAVCGH